MALDHLAVPISLYLLSKLCKNRVVKQCWSRECRQVALLECPLQLACRTEPTFCSPGLVQVEMEGPARVDVRRSGLQADIGHIFFELPWSQYSMKVSGKDLKVKPQPILLNLAVPEQPLPIGASSVLNSDVLSYTHMVLYHTRCLCVVLCVSWCLCKELLIWQNKREEKGRVSYNSITAKRNTSQTVRHAYLVALFLGIFVLDPMPS